MKAEFRIEENGEQQKARNERGQEKEERWWRE
jgi:hypothetical protein